MTSVIFKYEHINQQLENMLRSFHQWLSDKYIRNTPVTINFTNETFYVNDCMEDTLVFEDSCTIFYSLNDIEDYRHEVSYYSQCISADDNVLLTILHDICHKLAIFYIADKQHKSYMEVIEANRDNQAVEFLQQMMMYQYYFLTYKQGETSDATITLSYTRQVDKTLKKMLRLCTDYIKKHFDFPMPVSIKISTTKYGFAGQFSAPNSPFDKALINMTTKDYAHIVKTLGQYDAGLNICRVLLHEVIHYQLWIESKWFVDIEEEEKVVDELENQHINQFIDEYM